MSVERIRSPHEIDAMIPGSPFRLELVPEPDPAELDAELDSLTATGATEEPDEPPRPIARPAPSAATSEMVGEDLQDFLTGSSEPVAWFGPVVDGGLAAVVGRPESFKTMGMLHLGLAGAAGTSWLGLDLGEPRPFVYLSGEKSRATVRDRLERMTASLRITVPVRVIHRAGVSFGDRESWSRVVALVKEYGPRTFVVCDTLASLAGPGFNENDGRDMATVLGALRELGDVGATVAPLHHPSKYGDGAGGIRLRGHTSLWGEVDGTLEFTRPDRAVDAGLLRIEPKDGDLRLIHFEWNRETFLLEPVTGVLPLTVTSLIGVVDALYADTPLTSDRIRLEFPRHGRTVLLERLEEAVTAGKIARIGRGKSTRYLPIPRVMRPPEDWDSGPAEARSLRPQRADEWGFGAAGRMADEPSENRTNVLASGGRIADEGIDEKYVRSGGSMKPPRTYLSAGRIEAEESS